jgi:O-acetylhomoserine (thiol)-lyase
MFSFRPGAGHKPVHQRLLLYEGLETLHLRMERHSANALATAEFLKGAPEGRMVIFPGLISSPEKLRADRYLGQGAGAIIGFGIKAA